MGLHSAGSIIGRIFASEICGAYFREGLLSEFCGTVISIISDPQSTMRGSRK